MNLRFIQCSIAKSDMVILLSYNVVVDNLGQSEEEMSSLPSSGTHAITKGASGKPSVCRLGMEMNE